MSFGGGKVLSGPGITPRFMRRSKKLTAGGGPAVPVVVRSSRGLLSKRVRNINKKVKKIQRREELRHVDVQLAGTTIDNAGVFTLLNGCVQGDDDSNRQGNQISATSIQFKYILTADADQVAGSLVRVIIFWDLQANAAAPTSALLLDNTVITSLFNAPYNRNNQKRFKIVYDRAHVINPTVAGTVTPATGVTAAVLPMLQIARRKIKLSRTVKYNDVNGGTIADITSNSLYMFMVTNVAVAANQPTMTGGFRFFFKDT